MDNLRCVSCGKNMSKHYLYCYNCFNKLDALDYCKGVKVNGDPCMLKSSGHCCIYHCKKLSNDTSKQVTTSVDKNKQVSTSVDKNKKPVC